LNNLGVVAIKRRKDCPLHKISIWSSKNFTPTDVETLREVVEVDWDGRLHWSPTQNGDDEYDEASD